MAEIVEKQPAIDGPVPTGKGKVGKNEQAHRRVPTENDKKSARNRRLPSGNRCDENSNHPVEETKPRNDGGG